MHGLPLPKQGQSRVHRTVFGTASWGAVMGWLLEGTEAVGSPAQFQER